MGGWKQGETAAKIGLGEIILGLQYFPRLDTPGTGLFDFSPSGETNMAVVREREKEQGAVGLQRPRQQVSGTSERC